MTPQTDKIEDRNYYFLPRRMVLGLSVIEVVANKEYISTVEIMEVTGYSRPYITAFLTDLKREGIIGHSRGGYYFVNGIGGTNVGEVIEATFKDEDRTGYAEEIYRHLIDHLNVLTIEDLLLSVTNQA